VREFISRFPRALVPIYGITLMDVLGYTILIPLLPYIAQRHHASDFTVGVLMTTTAVCSTVSAPVWGWFSDRLGRKRIVMTSQLFSLAGYFLIAVAPDLAMIFVSRAVAGLGGGNLGVAESYIADVTRVEDRDLAYAAYGALFGLGFIIGPIVSGFLVPYGFGVPFFLAAFLEILNIAFTWKFLPTTCTDTERRVPHSPGEILTTLRIPRIGSLLGRQLLFIFAVTYFLTTFSLYVKHVLDYGPEFAGWLLALAGGVGGFTFLSLNPLVRRFGNNLVCELGFSLAILAYIGLSFVNGLGAFIAVMIVWAAGAALAEPTLTTLLSEAAPEDQRGAVLGLGDSANNLALMGAPALGAFMTGLNPRVAGLIPALVTAVAFLLGWIAWRKHWETPRSTTPTVRL
jgi:DHA1 family tetracycline resistance protein-like MFS transporter